MIEILSNLPSWNLLEMIPLYLHPVVIVCIIATATKALIGIVTG